jgi:hypothetical protein
MIRLPTKEKYAAHRGDKQRSGKQALAAIAIHRDESTHTSVG